MSDQQQAIIRTGGKQYRVETGAVLRVEKLNREVGTSFDIEDVLLVGRGDDVKVGAPVVKGAAVNVEVVSHGRGRKLIVFKFKPRRNYRKKAGHRQAYTELKVNAIRA